ncbi:hypothetical protein J4403_03000 [Candidatus Woesearchaeota archaeon]|nr:hypothetical protein [Candidatus Woesearchaeota archaeon]
MINYNGINDLKKEEISKIKEISEHELTKLEHCGKISEARLTLKVHPLEKKAKQYTISLNARCKEVFFESSASDWELSTAIHASFQKMFNEIKKKLKLVG